MTSFADPAAALVRMIERFDAFLEFLEAVAPHVSEWRDDHNVLTDVLTAPEGEAAAGRRARQLEEAAESRPDADALATAERSGRGGRVAPIFARMANKTNTQSVARRVAMMAVRSGFSPWLLRPMATRSSSMPTVTDTMLEDLVAPYTDEWEKLGRTARHLTPDPAVWTPLSVGLILVMWSPPMVPITGKQLNELRRWVDSAPVSAGPEMRRPVRSDTREGRRATKARQEAMVREFSRARAHFGITDDVALTSLRGWAGHCEWAHENVRSSS